MTSTKHNGFEWLVGHVYGNFCVAFDALGKATEH